MTFQSFILLIVDQNAYRARGPGDKADKEERLESLKATTAAKAPRRLSREFRATLATPRGSVVTKRVIHGQACRERVPVDLVLLALEAEPSLRPRNWRPIYLTPSQRGKENATRYS